MKATKLGAALALSLLAAGCGEKQSSGRENREDTTAGPAVSQAGDVYSGTGNVTAIAGDRITISHGPIEGIGWPAMTMAFGTETPDMAKGVRVGDRVSFAFRQDGGDYTLASLTKGQ